MKRTLLMRSAGKSKKTKKLDDLILDVLSNEDDARVTQELNESRREVAVFPNHAHLKQQGVLHSVDIGVNLSRLKLSFCIEAEEIKVTFVHGHILLQVEGQEVRNGGFIGVLNGR